MQPKFNTSLIHTPNSRTSQLMFCLWSPLGPLVPVRSVVTPCKSPQYVVKRGHTHKHTHTLGFHHSGALLTLSRSFRLCILIVLTKILTFISRMHVEGSRRIRFRWRTGSQRAANEIWTAEPRPRVPREGGRDVW